MTTEDNIKEWIKELFSETNEYRFTLMMNLNDGPRKNSPSYNFKADTFNNYILNPDYHYQDIKDFKSLLISRLEKLGVEQENLLFASDETQRDETIDTLAQLCQIFRGEGQPAKEFNQEHGCNVASKDFLPLLQKTFIAQAPKAFNFLLNEFGLQEATAPEDIPEDAEDKNNNFEFVDNSLEMPSAPALEEDPDSVIVIASEKNEQPVKMSSQPSLTVNNQITVDNTVSGSGVVKLNIASSVSIDKEAQGIHVSQEETKTSTVTSVSFFKKVASWFSDDVKPSPTNKP